MEINGDDIENRGVDAPTYSQRLHPEPLSDCTVADPSDAPDPSPDPSPSPRVPDGGWGWMVVAGSTLSHTLLVGMARSFGVLFVLLLYHFNRSSGETAWITAIFNMVRTLNSPLCSWMCERWGSRVVSVTGALISCAGISLTAFISNVYVVYITFGIIGGFGAGMTFTACYIIVGDYFDKHKGKAMGLSTMGCGIGTLFFGPLISHLGDRYGYFGTFLLLGGIQLNIAVGGMLYRPVKLYSRNSDNPSSLEMQVLSDKGDLTHPVEDAQTNNSENKTIEPPAKSEKSKLCSSLCSEGSLIRNWTFLLFCFLMCAMQICIQAFLLFMPAYSLQLGASPGQASLLVTLYGGGDVLGRVVFGVLFDVPRIRAYRVYVYCAMSVAYGLVTVSVGLSATYLGCAILAPVVGMLQAGCHGQRATVVGDIVAKHQVAKSVGLLLFSQGIGSITGAPFAGFLRDLTGTNASSLFFSGAPIIIAGLLLGLQLKFCSCGSRGED